MSHNLLDQYQKITQTHATETFVVSTISSIVGYGLMLHGIKLKNKSKENDHLKLFSKLTKTTGKSFISLGLLSAIYALNKKLNLFNL